MGKIRSDSITLLNGKVFKRVIRNIAIVNDMNVGVFFLYHQPRYCMLSAGLKKWFEVPADSEAIQKYKKEKQCSF